MKNKKLRPLLITAVCLFLFAAAGICFIYFYAFHFKNDGIRKADTKAVTDFDYDLLLLANHSPETLDPAPLEYYVGGSVYHAKHCFENLRDYTDYLNIALTSSDSLKQIYSFLDPGLMGKSFLYSAKATDHFYHKNLLPCIEDNPQITYHFFLPSYSLEYWCGMKDSETGKYLEHYRLFCDLFQALPNVRIYFFGHEDWLIASPLNYISPESCLTEVNTRLMALSMWNNNYLLTPDSTPSAFLSLEEKISAARTAPAAPDFSDLTIVFLGDSIIENAGGLLSIPDIVNSSTGAETYNLAIGGQTASVFTEEPFPCLGTSLDYLLERTPDPLLEDHAQFLTETDRFLSSDHSGQQLCFVLAYGLNDYFNARPISNPDDPFDPLTYSGALQSAIDRIGSAYPDAELILCAPTFITMYKNGTEPQAENAGILTDYVDEVLRIAEKNKIPCLNLHEALGINGENGGLYLEDQCHLNEKGRYLYGVRFVEFLEEK